MDIYVYDDHNVEVKVIDQYASLVWTERYATPGEFELVIPFDPQWRTYLWRDYTVRIQETECGMVIDKIVIDRDDDGKLQITVSGKSYEALLYRRCIEIIPYVHPTYGKTFPEILRIILGRHPMYDDPEYNDTELMKLFDYVEATDQTWEEDTIITKAPEYPEPFGDWVEKYCKEFNLGYTVRLLPSGKFGLQLYKGYDVSGTSIVRNSGNVVLSEDSEALSDAQLVYNWENAKNYAYYKKDDVAWEIESSYDDVRSPAIWHRSVVVNDGYVTAFTQLAESMRVKAIDCNANANGVYKYGVDYILGDLVKVSSSIDPGHIFLQRVSEVTISDDENGYKRYITFDNNVEHDGRPWETSDI